MNALSPLAGVYAAAVAARNSLYDTGALATKRLRRPVVRVGNLRVGGTGKTPFTIHLGELLQERKVAFDILSRGYGRSSTRVALVDEKGSAAEFGDEPLLMAGKLGVPVVVGADRYAAGALAEKLFAELQPSHGSQWLHLLDDGFQHRRLHRDFDIVLVSAEDAEDSMLPAGRLREPLSALRRADAIVLVDGASTAGLPVENKFVWRARRKIAVENAPARPFAFCGVARPERFLSDLKTAGVETAGKEFFRDHHAYSERDIRRLAALRAESNAGGTITTEKDEINLRRNPEQLLKLLEPMAVVRMKLELDEPTAAVEAVLKACAAAQPVETINLR